MMHPSIPPRGAASNRHDAAHPAIQASDVVGGGMLVVGDADDLAQR